MKGRRQKSTGAVLAIVMIFITMMLVMIYVLNQIVLNQQKTVNNYTDNLLAQNYAKMALLQAESTAFNFDAGNFSTAGFGNTNDTTKNFEQPTNNCCNTTSNSLSFRRFNILQALPPGSVNVTINTVGTVCSSGTAYKGLCYLQSDSLNYGSSESWQPWTLSSSNAVIPCASYLPANNSSNIMLDDQSSQYSVLVQTGDNSLCAQPRFMLEPINLDYHGHWTAPVSNTEHDYIYQANGANIISYSVTSAGVVQVPSTRLYRLTVRAFGRNGNTRVTLQEIVAIEAFNSNRSISPTPIVADDLTNLQYRIIPLSIRWLH